jgi:hypothetical protein
MIDFGFFPFSLWWLVSLAIQLFFAVHAVRNGKPWWLLILFFFPFVGSLVYLFVEYLPSRHAGGVEDAARGIARRLNPGAEVRRLEDQVAHNPSVDNRMELLHRLCLSGVHGGDPKVLYALAEALHANGQVAEARQTFDLLRQHKTPSREQLLLSARIHEDAGELEEAAREYAPLARHAVGEEARTRYGLLLRRLGRHDEARSIFEEVLRHARMSPGFYRREHREWIAIARRELKSGPASAS